MANTRSKIDKFNLGALVARLRDQGYTNAQIHEALQSHLKQGQTLTLRTVDAYVAKLPAKTIAVIHDPDTTREVTKQVESFGDQFADLNRIVRDWLNDVKDARVKIVTDHGVQDGGPDWNSRVKVAKELREQIKLIADVMERIYNAEQIKLFQESVLEAVGEASPEVAQAIRDKLRERTEIRRAALLGV